MLAPARAKYRRRRVASGRESAVKSGSSLEEESCAWRSRLLTRRALLDQGASRFAAAVLGSRLAGSATAAPVRASNVRLLVVPNPVADDAPFAVRLDGLAAGQVLTLRAEMTDGAYLRWTAEATFVADDLGGVDLRTETPRDGTYAEADPMGLVWSAVPDNGLGANNAVLFVPSLRPRPLMMTVEVDGVVMARTEVDRRLLTPAV